MLSINMEINFVSFVFKSEVNRSRFNTSAVLVDSNGAVVEHVRRCPILVTRFARCSGGEIKSRTNVQFKVAVIQILDCSRNRSLAVSVPLSMFHLDFTANTVVESLVFLHFRLVRQTGCAVGEKK